MNGYTMYLPSYTVGDDAYSKIPEVCRPFGKKAVAIGGKTAIEKSKDAILKGIEGSDIEVIDFIWYGGEATYENGDMVLKNPAVAEADYIFAIGGGKAIDTCKYVAREAKKKFFTFPTIASTCAASSAIGVIYYPDGSMKEVFVPDSPAVHSFINTKIIAEAPEVYLWAGIGDTLAKYYEVTFSGRGCDLLHSDALGTAMSVMTAEPLVKFGTQALEDCKKNESTLAIQQAALCILLTTGIVSSFVDTHINSNMAHSLFYGFTKLHQIESRHLHGEVVSYGVLCLLTMDKQFEERDRLYKFYKSIKLPTKLADIEVTVDELDPVFDKAMTTYDIEKSPYKITREMMLQSIIDLEEYNKKKEAE